MITIVDYGLGNLGSIMNMFKRIGVQSKIVSDPLEISDSTKILLPGVGSFDAAMKKINDGGFLAILKRKATEDKVPFLGICLGMQLLTKRSEEGDLDGLGFFDAGTVKFKFPDKKLKVPHMGWNSIKVIRETAITSGMAEEEYRFYFVHSYFVINKKEEDVAAVTNYGLDFSSIISQGNIHGAQFHPEKSHRFGMKLFRNFADI